MKDFLDNPVQEGDHIFYSTTGRNAASRHCKILKIGNKFPTVKVLKCSRWGEGKTVVVQNYFVKVNHEP